MLDWSDAEAEQIAGGVVKAGVLFRCATEPVIRLWAGVGDVEIPADLVETATNASYMGMGELQSLPPMTQLINGLAERVDFSLSGVAITGEVAAIASGAADDIRQAEVNVGIFAMDDDYQRISPVFWFWDGIADVLNVDRQAQGGKVNRTLTLSVGSLFTGRRRPSLSAYTSAEQRLRSATDAFCDRVRLLEAGSTRVWPE